MRCTSSNPGKEDKKVGRVEAFKPEAIQILGFGLGGFVGGEWEREMRFCNLDMPDRAVWAWPEVRIRVIFRMEEIELYATLIRRFDGASLGWDG